jgi:hypothetical protein
VTNRRARSCAMKAKKSGVGLLNDIERWRTRAKETRTVAETMRDGVACDALLQVANDWEQMAQLAEESEENIAALRRIACRTVWGATPC